MREVYRGHEIVLLDDDRRSLVIVDCRTGIYLPTKVTAGTHEAFASSFRRARELIDLYLDASSRE